jgi:molybdopterin-guanine dinucleotide biosynthesis protein A
MTGLGALPPVGLVLAGGESRRLRSDKARLEGAALPLGATERLAVVCTEVAVADRGRELVPGRRSLADGAGGGPAAGILGGAAAYPGRPLLVLACDLPQVPAGLLAELAGSEAADWVVPRWEGGLEPLCAFYGPAALAALAARVREGRFALHDLASEEGLAVRYLEGEALRRFGDPEKIFFNLNTPGDLARWREA